jgi:hypothetical protein
MPGRMVRDHVVVTFPLNTSGRLVQDISRAEVCGLVTERDATFLCAEINGGTEPVHAVKVYCAAPDYGADIAARVGTRRVPAAPLRAEVSDLPARSVRVEHVHSGHHARVVFDVRGRVLSVQVDEQEVWHS